MFPKQVLVCLTFILMTCSSSELAQRSGSPSTLGGQIVLSSKGSLKDPVIVLLDDLGARNNQRTSTDLHGNFEFRNIPQGSYSIRLRLEGFENVNYQVSVPGTPYVFIFLNGTAALSRNTDTHNPRGGNHVVDVRQLMVPRQAIKEYEKAVEEIKRHDSQRAIEQLKKSIKLAPDFYNARACLGQEYRKANRLDDAEEEFNRAAKLNPNDDAPLIELGEIYMEKRDLRRAADVLTRAVRRSPRSAVAHYALGRARYSLSQYEEAKREES